MQVLFHYVILNDKNVLNTTILEDGKNVSTSIVWYDLSIICI